jgi:hypothetical protein
MKGSLIVLQLPDALAKKQMRHANANRVGQTQKPLPANPLCIADTFSPMPLALHYQP